MNSTPAASFADTTVIIAFRAAQASRVAGLAFVLQHYAQWPELEVLLVEQDAAASTFIPALPANARRLFLRNPGAFNKSWALNVGARESTRALLLFADADMLLAPKALLQSARLCRQRAIAIKPFARQVDLDQAETTALLSGAAAPDWDRSDGSSFRRENERLNFCSGVFMIRRESFFALGGMDERFLGWGGEDDAMAFKLRRSGQPLARIDDSTALHLWHEQDHASTFGQPHFANNLALLNTMQEQDDSAFRFQCEVQRQLLGHARKYELAAAAVSMRTRSSAA